MNVSNVAGFLLIPVDIVFSLIRNPQEASCLLETTFRGQQLQDLLSLQATQQQCDVSALQKVCTSLLSLNDASLAALVPPAIQAASAATHAADLTQTKLKECLDALHMLSGHLKRQSEITSAVAVEMRRQPTCQELAIERELVAAIQAEAAQRAGHIARLRGHCTTLPPFSQALESFKAEAANKLQRLSESGGGGIVVAPPANAQMAAPAAPFSTVVTKDRLDNIERGLHAMNAHVNQLVRLQSAAAAASGAGPPQAQIEHQPGAINLGQAALQGQPILETSPELGVAPPRIQEISPGGTEQPEIIRSLTFQKQQQQQPQRRRREEDGEEEEREKTRGRNQEHLPQGHPQQSKATIAPEYSQIAAKRNKREMTLTQSKAPLRGDAAPSSSTDADEYGGNENGSSGGVGIHKSQSQIDGDNLKEKDNDNDDEKSRQQQQQSEFCFIPPVTGGVGSKIQQGKEDEEEQEPSPTPQVAANNNNNNLLNTTNILEDQQQQRQVDDDGGENDGMEHELEKENFDATQSQGDASAQRTGSKQEPEKEEEDGENENEGVPSTQPLDNVEAEEDVQHAAQPSQEKMVDSLNHMHPSVAVASLAVEPAEARARAAPAVAPPAAAPVPNAGAVGMMVNIAGRGFMSQRDSYSPGSTLNPGSGAHTGSGSGSGVAPLAGAAGAGRGRNQDNEDTPAGPSRVAPTPVSLLCCPPPLPPPSFPSSSSAGVGPAATGGAGGAITGEKRSYQVHQTGVNAAPVAANGGGGARVKRTRFATEAQAAAAAAFEREKSASQDLDASLPLSGPSAPSSGHNTQTDGSGSGGHDRDRDDNNGGGGGIPGCTAPGTADWKTPAEVQYTNRTYGGQILMHPTLSTWNFSQEGQDFEQPTRRPTTAAAAAGGGDVNATPLNQTLHNPVNYHQHKSWVPSTIKPPPRYRDREGGSGGRFNGGFNNREHPIPAPHFGGGGSDQGYPFSQDSPRVAGAQKGATPLFVNSLPTNGDVGNTLGGAAAVTPATCASWKAGVARIIDTKRREKEEREEEEEDQGGEDGCNASNQLRRKTPGS